MQDYSALVSALPIIISAASLFIVIYTQFIQGARLSSAITQVILLRTPDSLRRSLTIEMLLDDLLSENRSDAAQVALTSVVVRPEDWQVPLRDKDRDALRTYISGQGAPIYTPPRNIMEAYVKANKVPTSIYIPLVIYNSGRKQAHVGALFLIARSKDAPEKEWKFQASTEFDPDTLIQRAQKPHDTDRFHPFSGAAVGAQSSIRIDPVFEPTRDGDLTKAAQFNLPVGHYELTAYGFSAPGKLICKTERIDFHLKEQYYFGTIRNYDMAVNVLDERILERINK